jgi:hypothetical protein
MLGSDTLASRGSRHSPRAAWCAASRRLITSIRSATVVLQGSRGGARSRRPASTVHHTYSSWCTRICVAPSHRRHPVASDCSSSSSTTRVALCGSSYWRPRIRLQRPSSSSRRTQKQRRGRKLGTLRTDRGGEFTARAFGEYCAEQGIQRHLTAPYTPSRTGWWRGATRPCWAWPGAC